MNRRLLLILTLGAVVALFVIPLNPVHSKVLKLPYLAAIGLVWLGPLLFFWREKRVRYGILAVPILLGAFLAVPGGEIDREELRGNYVRRLSGFEGTKYYWGGENARGIDCSGLPRRAIREALFSYGLRHGNPRALRMGMEQWWFDATARGLGEGVRGYTKPLGPSGPISKMDYDGLEAGDLAVTRDGVHMLAYVGEGRWIQAEPHLGRVVTLRGREDRNGWFENPVRTHRWAVLVGE